MREVDQAWGKKRMAQIGIVIVRASAVPGILSNFDLQGHVQTEFLPPTTPASFGAFSNHRWTDSKRPYKDLLCDRRRQAMALDDKAQLSHWGLIRVSRVYGRARLLLPNRYVIWAATRS